LPAIQNVLITCKDWKPTRNLREDYYRPEGDTFAGSFAINKIYIRTVIMYYEIHVEWDDEAKVWYIEDSNVPAS
jgi:hypothetical protein